jgi:hypothetical protein
MTGVPAWLQRHLENLGVWSADGINRRVRVRTCRCGARVLVGLDADRCAATATADPGPLDNIGEFAARLNSRQTYRLQYDSSRRGWTLDYRDQINIEASPPDHNTHVLPEHQCGKPIPALGPPIKNPHPPKIATYSGDEPPF